MLAGLPPEILEGVANQVEDEDLKALRLTSSVVRDKLIHHCGTRIFKTVLTDLSRDSLESISLIARNDDIARYVHNMTIRGLGLRYIEGGPRSTVDLGRGYPWPRDRSGCLDAPCPGLEKLRTLLQLQLVNCRTIQIGRTIQHPPEYPGPLNPSDSLQLVLLLISKYGIKISNICPVEQNFVRNSHKLPCSTIAQPLRVGGAEAWNAMESFTLQDVQEWPQNRGWLNNLFGLMTGLRELTFVPMEEVNTTGLLESVFFISSPVLSRLIIGTLGLEDGRLLKLLHKWADTLRHFELCTMIHYGNKASWMKTFRRIPRVLPHLRSFVINHIWWYDGHTRSNIYYEQASNFADGIVGPGVNTKDTTVGANFVKFAYQHPGDPSLKLAIRTEEHHGDRYVSGFECEGDRVADAIQFMAKIAQEAKG